jgi:hypothetical protein
MAYSWVQRIQITALFCFLLSAYIGNTPEKISPVAFQLAELQDFPRNGLLEQASALFAGEMKAPEAFTIGPVQSCLTCFTDDNFHS